MTQLKKKLFHLCCIDITKCHCKKMQTAETVATLALAPWGAYQQKETILSVIAQSKKPRLVLPRLQSFAFSALTFRACKCSFRLSVLSAPHLKTFFYLFASKTWNSINLKYIRDKKLNEEHDRKKKLLSNKQVRFPLSSSLVFYHRRLVAYINRFVL